MYRTPVRSISKAELQLGSLKFISLRGTKIKKLNLRGCSVLKEVLGADQPGREVSTADDVYRG